MHPLEPRQHRPFHVEWCNRQSLMIKRGVILKKLGYFEGPTRRIRAMTSSFRRCAELVAIGVCPAEEDGGVCNGYRFASSCVILCKRSSIFVFIASWDAESFAIASSNRFAETLERVASAIDAQWKHQCCDLDFEDQKASVRERRRREKERKLYLLIIPCMILYKLLYLLRL